MSRPLFLLTNLVGLLGFLLPFWPGAGGRATPLLFLFLVSLAALLLVAELSAHLLDARSIALMGILAAVNALLRLLDNSFIVLPGGFSPIFLLIIVCGYLFGGTFGFLFGLLSLLVSALVTGGIGPWLPYQMIAAGWMGGLAARLPHPQGGKAQVAVLALYGLGWGFLYGFLLDLYAWPFITGPAAPTEALTLRRYLLYYATTSLWWDAARAVGNAALTLLLGKPLLRLLDRFRRRGTIVREPLDVAPCAVGEHIPSSPT